MKTCDLREYIFDFYKTRPDDRLVWSHDHNSMWIGYINDISRGFLISISDSNFVDIIKFREFENENSDVIYELQTTKHQTLSTLEKLEDEGCYSKFSKFIDICTGIKTTYKDTSHLSLSIIGSHVICSFKSQFPGKPDISDHYLLSLDLSTTNYYQKVYITRLSRAVKHNTSLDYCDLKLQEGGYRHHYWMHSVGSDVYINIRLDTYYKSLNECLDINWDYLLLNSSVRFWLQFVDLDCFRNSRRVE